MRDIDIVSEKWDGAAAVGCRYCAATIAFFENSAASVNEIGGVWFAIRVERLLNATAARVVLIIRDPQTGVHVGKINKSICVIVFVIRARAAAVQVDAIAILIVQIISARRSGVLVHLCIR